MTQPPTAQGFTTPSCTHLNISSSARSVVVAPNLPSQSRKAYPRLGKTTNYERVASSSVHVSSRDQSHAVSEVGHRCSIQRQRRDPFCADTSSFRPCTAVEKPIQRSAHDLCPTSNCEHDIERDNNDSFDYDRADTAQHPFVQRPPAVSVQPECSPAPREAHCCAEHRDANCELVCVAYYARLTIEKSATPPLQSPPNRLSRGHRRQAVSVSTAKAAMGVTHLSSIASRLASKLEPLKSEGPAIPHREFQIVTFP